MQRERNLPDEIPTSHNFPCGPDTRTIHRIAEYSNHKGSGCRDDDPSVHSGATEVCDDGKDNDCNGHTDCDDLACLSESSELHSLPEVGLQLIDLDFKSSKRTDQYGNHFSYRSKVKDIHGAQLGRWAWDVYLVSH